MGLPIVVASGAAIPILISNIRFHDFRSREENADLDNHATSQVRAGGTAAPKLPVQIIILHFLPQDFVLETLWKGGTHEKIT